MSMNHHVPEILMKALFEKYIKGSKIYPFWDGSFLRPYSIHLIKMAGLFELNGF